MPTPRNRKPAGTPVGGQFATSTHPRPSIELDPDGEAAAELLATRWAAAHVRRRLAGRVGIDAEDVAQACWAPLRAAIAGLPPADRCNPEAHRKLLPRLVRTTLRGASEANAPAPTNETRRASSMSLVLRGLPADVSDEEAISAWRERHPTSKVSDKLLRVAIRTARDGHPSTASLDALPAGLAPTTIEGDYNDVETALTMRALRGKRGPLTAEEKLFLAARLQLGGPSQAEMIRHMRRTHRWSDRRTRRVDGSLARKLYAALGVIPDAS